MKFYLLLFILTYNINYSQTRDQIIQAKEIINASGLTKKEVEKHAVSSGYSSEQVDKLYENNLNNKLENINESSGLTNDDLESTQKPYTEESDVITDNEDEAQKLNNSSSHQKINSFNNNYFGYDIFYQDPSLFQASSVGALDPNYQIGPGDEIILMLWGETQFRQVLKVNREGFIFISEIGQVFVNGLNLNLLETKLFKVL